MLLGRSAAATARLALFCVLAIAIAAPPWARAQQSIDVAALVKLVEEQPADMDRVVWKEKRREAAKRLGTIRDKRAVTALIKVAESESFDIIGEIAIQGLGQLADPAAIPALQRIAADPAREKSQRELARKTLAKLGGAAPPEGGSSGGTSSGGSSGGSSSGGSSTSGGSSGGTSSSGGGSSGGTSSSGGGSSRPSGGAGGSGGSRPAPPAGGTGETAPTEEGTETPTTEPDPSAASAILGDEGDLPQGPAWAPEILAASERLTLAAGSARFDYDTTRKRPSFDADIAATYDRRVEETRRVLAWGGDARVVAGFVNPEGAGSNRGLVVAASGHGEARFYSGNLYGIGQAVGRFGLTYLSIDRADPNVEDTKDARTSADLEIALGGGWGRVLDIGGQLRVRRVARALERNRALGRPIDDELARQLQSTWWALRGSSSARQLLTATVALLRKAGVLLGEPDAGLTYELLAVLRDAQLVDRPSGMDVWVGFGEGYLLREDVAGVAQGRVEQALVRARFGQQSDDGVRDLSATAFARLALFTGDQPAPWALGVAARARRFTYRDDGDPIGAFDVAAELGLSSDDTDETDAGLRLGAEVGFSWSLSLASALRVAGRVISDSGELTMVGLIEARYGLLDGTFAAGP